MGVATLSGQYRAEQFHHSARVEESDELLANSVVTAVRVARLWLGRNLNVVAEDGRVTLRGTARSFYEKQLILNAVQRVDGVREIVDELAVVPAASESA